MQRIRRVVGGTIVAGLARRVVAVACCAFVACACAPVAKQAATPMHDGARAMPGAQVWMTTQDRRLALSRLADAPFVPAASSDAEAGAGAEVRIVVDPARRYQRMVGFGAAITDASAWLIAHRMDARQRDALLRELFGRGDGGIGFDFTRLTIGASDFSRRQYSLDDMPPGGRDPALAHFGIAPNLDDVVPVVRQALRINPRLFVMASPWSAPAWMKTGGSLRKGTLRPEDYGVFARYLVRYVDAYAAQGIPVSALTLQNEPAFEPEDYPGMRLDAAARATIIGRHLGPMLAGRTPAVRIFDWDHNWDKPEQPLAVLRDARAARYVDAVAWHCYAGDVSAQSRVHDAFPGKDAYLTECSGGEWEPVKSGGIAGQVRTLVIGATRNWARGVLFWNLALDERRGPHTGGCDTCRGVVRIDAASGGVERTDDYYALAHASRFVLRDAERLASSAAQGGIDNVAFRNPDGALVLVVANSAAAARHVSVVEGARAFAADLPAGGVATFVWQDSPAAR